jgi:MarR family transcriptional regulator, organic hydroperoxide resistance regulator
MANIGRMHAKRADRFMERFGLFRGQAILLKVLFERDGLTHSEIAEKLEISPAAGTKVIKRMESLNYVRRSPDPTDERISRVFLLPEGAAVVHQIENAFDQIDQVLLSQLNSDEQRTLIDLLWKVYNGLLEHEDDADIHQAKDETHQDKFIA